LTGAGGAQQKIRRGKRGRSGPDPGARPASLPEQGRYNTMALKDLIPWNRERSVDVARRSEEPFWSLHREVNRLFEDFARGLDLAPASGYEGFGPRVDVRETDDTVLVEAEMPGLE